MLHNNILWTTTIQTSRDELLQLSNNQQILSTKLVQSKRHGVLLRQGSRNKHQKNTSRFILVNLRREQFLTPSQTFLGMYFFQSVLDGLLTKYFKTITQVTKKYLHTIKFELTFSMSFKTLHLNSYLSSICHVSVTSHCFPSQLKQQLLP